MGRWCPGGSEPRRGEYSCLSLICVSISIYTFSVSWQDIDLDTYLCGMFRLFYTWRPCCPSLWNFFWKLYITWSPGASFIKVTKMLRKQGGNVLTHLSPPTLWFIKRNQTTPKEEEHSGYLTHIAHITSDSFYLFIYYSFNKKHPLWNMN